MTRTPSPAPLSPEEERKTVIRAIAAYAGHPVGKATIGDYDEAIALLDRVLDAARTPRETPELDDGHEHVTIRIDKRARQELRARLFEDDMRGVGYTDFILDAVKRSREAPRETPELSEAASVAALERAMGTLRNEAVTVHAGLRAQGVTLHAEAYDANRDELRARETPAGAVEALADADKLLVLAAWFDMWDRPETDRAAILTDERNPGRNDVQRDLRRLAVDVERWQRIETAARPVLAELDDTGADGSSLAEFAAIVEVTEALRDALGEG